ncbi:MAG TPA: dihydroorotate dehydrogenase (quinone), partial [Flavobacteriales bacterium]|nr:dihydroorotate dehydrogenase (quinone) [Flavobacteriales bacterium]
MYRLVRPLLFLLPAEKAHHLTYFLLKLVSWIPGVPGLLGARPVPREAQVEVMGLRFPSPVGLAAGMDKDAKHVKALFRMGFGFIEVGTLTPRPQPGNERPRLFRLPKDRALINRMGFNNGGVKAAAKRLRKVDP